jgi:hypothetical protein
MTFPGGSGPVHSLFMKGGSLRIVNFLRLPLPSFGPMVISEVFTLFFIFRFSSDAVIYVLEVWFIFNLLGSTRSSYFILIFENLDNLGIWFFFNLLVFYEELTPRHATSRHVTSRHSLSPHFTSPHVTSRHLTLPRTMSRYVMSLHVTSPHVTPCHVTPRHTTSHHVMSRHVTSRHAASRHVTSCYATPRHDFNSSFFFSERWRAPVLPHL